MRDIRLKKVKKTLFDIAFSALSYLFFLGLSWIMIVVLKGYHEGGSETGKSLFMLFLIIAGLLMIGLIVNILIQIFLNVKSTKHKTKFYIFYFISIIDVVFILKLVATKFFIGVEIMFPVCAVLLVLKFIVAKFYYKILRCWGDG